MKKYSFIVLTMCLCLFGISTSYAEELDDITLYSNVLEDDLDVIAYYDQDAVEIDDDCTLLDECFYENESELDCSEGDYAFDEDDEYCFEETSELTLDDSSFENYLYTITEDCDLSTVKFVGSSISELKTLYIDGCTCSVPYGMDLVNKGVIVIINGGSLVINGPLTNSGVLETLDPTCQIIINGKVSIEQNGNNKGQLYSAGVMSIAGELSCNSGCFVNTDEMSTTVLNGTFANNGSFYSLGNTSFNSGTFENNGTTYVYSGFFLVNPTCTVTGNGTVRNYSEDAVIEGISNSDMLKRNMSQTELQEKLNSSNNSVTLYNTIILDTDLYIPEGKTLKLYNGASLQAGGYTIFNQGTLTINKYAEVYIYDMSHYVPSIGAVQDGEGLFFVEDNSLNVITAGSGNSVLKVYYENPSHPDYPVEFEFKSLGINGNCSYNIDLCENDQEKQSDINVSHTSANSIICVFSTSGEYKLDFSVSDDNGFSIISDPIVISVPEHVPGFPITGKKVSATCEEAGYYENIIKCKVCGEILETKIVEIKQRQHAWISVPAEAATCAKDGHTSGSMCSWCKKYRIEPVVIKAETVDHKIVIDEPVNADCENPGESGGTHCSVCNKILSGHKEIPALGHVVVIDEAVAATTENPGKTEGSHCDVCGKVFVEQKEIPKLLEDGWHTINGSKYYYVNGMPRTGWVYDQNKWYYMNSEGVMCTGWRIVNGVWYYLNPAGDMKSSSWLYYNGDWYYMDSSGAMAIGWRKIGSTWYYMNPSGVMKSSSWLYYNGDWYYMDASGAMAVGWRQIAGSWYYMDSAGIMVTGWRMISGSRYYFGSSGSMLTGWRLIGNNWYYMQSGGRMTTGWEKIGNSWYYFHRTDGRMLTGKQTIDGVEYEFDKSGELIENAR